MKKFILWLLTLSCMAAIFYFSSQVAEISGKTSSGLIVKIIRFFDYKDKLTDDGVESIRSMLSTPVRKAAHFSIYALLGFLVSLLIGEYGVSGYKKVIYASGISFLYACSDEIHQIFVEGRSCELRDILIDTCGAFTGVLISLFIIAFLKYLKGKKENGI